jgi:hypothetical protein
MKFFSYILSQFIHYWCIERLLIYKVDFISSYIACLYGVVIFGWNFLVLCAIRSVSDCQK